jgi:23S rRNA (uridine2552-2'-O)-methyltransferase
MTHSNYNKKDRFYHKAKAEGFLARSAYKLQEMQQRFKVIKRGDKVLDLGCAPGAWSQVALPLVGREGKIVGIDLEAIDLSKFTPQLRFIHGDAFKLTPEQLPEAPFDCVLSDMAPKTSGIKVRDQAASVELCMKAIELADSTLRYGGTIILKMLEGEDSKDVTKALQKRFELVKHHRPESTRAQSSEVFVLGFKFKGAPQIQP